MKRKLDDIELEEFEHFYIDHTTLIIKIKNENISYSYPNSLELLKRIGYLLHRYEVEYNRKENRKKEKSVISLTPVQKECQKRLTISHNIVFGVYIGYTLLIMMFPNISSILLNIFMAINSFVLGNAIREAHIMKQEMLKQIEKRQNNETQLEKGYESLKEAALSYVNKITQATTNLDEDEKHYIEVIEKGFQKRIGTYPQ